MSDQVAKPRVSLRLVWKLVVAGFVFLLAAILLLPSLGTGHSPSTSRLSMVNMRQIQIAALAYAADHNDQWPDTFDRFAKEYLAGSNEGERSVFINPRDGYLTYRLVHPGVVLDELSNSANTPVLYEVRDDGMIDLHGIIGYADGHVAWSPQRVED